MFIGENSMHKKHLIFSERCAILCYRKKANLCVSVFRFKLNPLDYKLTTISLENLEKLENPSEKCAQKDRKTQ